MVKLIGDEILYTAGDERSGCMIAFKLTEALADHNVIPPVRIGMRQERCCSATETSSGRWSILQPGR